MLVELETMDFPEYTETGYFYNYKFGNKYSSSRIIRLSWILCDSEHNKIAKDYIVKTDFDISSKYTEFHKIRAKYYYIY